MGAEQARFCTPFASPTAGPAIRRPRRSAAQATPVPVRTHCAHPLGRRPRVLVARQHAVSEPTPLTCVHGCGRGRGCRITRLGRMERVLSSCTLCDAVERRVGRVRGQKQRAWLCRAGRRRGQIWGVLGACRGVAGDVPGRWPGRRHARITQRRHVEKKKSERPRPFSKGPAYVSRVTKRVQCAAASTSASASCHAARPQRRTSA